MAYLWPIDQAPAPTGLQLYGTKRGSGKHAGCDISAPLGAPVLAIGRGRVVRVIDGRKPGQSGFTGATLRPGVSGNGVIIQHAPHRYSLYGHVAPTVRVGEWVHAGDIIGRVDVSGVTDGPHLHLELHDALPAADTHYDPLKHDFAHNIMEALMDSTELEKRLDKIEQMAAEALANTSWLKTRIGGSYKTSPSIAEELRDIEKD